MFPERVLAQCYSDLKGRFAGRKEDYFAVLYLAKKLGISHEEAARWCTFGGYDYGIDAYYADDKSNNLFLYQFKWSDSVAQMTASIDRLTDAGLRAIFGNAPVQTGRNESINRLRADILERKGKIERVFLYLISRTPLPDRSANASLDSRLEDLEREMNVVRAFFGRPEMEIFIRVNDDATSPPRFHFPITWEERLSSTLPTGEILEVGFASLLEFADIYSQMGLRLLQKNIRAGLATETSPNRSLKKAFIDIADGKANPETFVFHHNGISVEALDLVAGNGKTAEIVEPRVLNGAQTIVTLARLLAPEKGTPLDDKQRSRLKNIRVLGKIIRKCSESFVTDVTIRNNKQNPVEPWNLRACDRYQIDLEQRFKEPPTNLHYDRLQNSFAAKGQQDWEEEGVKAGRVIELRKLAMTLAAADGEIDRMSRIPDLFEQETQYRETFKPRYIEEGYDLRRIVLAYKIQYCLRRVLDEISLRGKKRYDFIWRARNLVWALVIQGLLNEDDLPDHLEQFGTDLRAGDDFRDRLGRIATSKLVPILSRAIEGSTYKQQIEAEKFSFLKSNAFYKACLSQAYERFEWTRVRL